MPPADVAKKRHPAYAGALALPVHEAQKRRGDGFSVTTPVSA